MKIEKKVNFLLSGFVFSLLVFFSFLFYKNHIHLQKINTNEEHWIDAPGLIAVTHREQNKPVLSVYRMSDATVEKLIGNWNYNYFYQDELAIYGTKLDEPNRQTLYFLTARGGNPVNISKLPGEITSMSRNAKGSYLLVSGINISTSTNEYYTCVAEKKGSLSPCIDIQKDILKKFPQEKNTYFHSFWNLKTDRFLAIKEIGGKNRLFTYDPWETSAELLTNTSTIDSIQELPNKQVIQTQNEDSFRRVGDIAIFKNYHTKGKLYVYVPSNNPIILISRRHFLFQKSNKFYILNTQRQTIEEFADAPTDIERISTLFSEYKKES